jgi:phosphoribosyl-ATP pyrophosphohydrolase
MILDDIQKIILERKTNPTPNSYVSTILGRGKDEILRKIGEESIEVILASKASDRNSVVHEIADLWFHCIILMTVEDVALSDILNELEKRSNQKR